MVDGSTWSAETACSEDITCSERQQETRKGPYKLLHSLLLKWELIHLKGINHSRINLSKKAIMVLLPPIWLYVLKVPPAATNTTLGTELVPHETLEGKPHPNHDKILHFICMLYIVHVKINKYVIYYIFISFTLNDGI
jgi:hypothetical protein